MFVTKEFIEQLKETDFNQASMLLLNNPVHQLVIIKADEHASAFLEYLKSEVIPENAHPLEISVFMAELTFWLWPTLQNQNLAYISKASGRPSSEAFKAITYLQENILTGKETIGEIFDIIATVQWWIILFQRSQ